MQCTCLGKEFLDMIPKNYILRPSTHHPLSYFIFILLSAKKTFFQIIHKKANLCHPPSRTISPSYVVTSPWNERFYDRAFDNVHLALRLFCLWIIIISYLQNSGKLPWIILPRLVSWLGGLLNLQAVMIIKQRDWSGRASPSLRSQPFLSSFDWFRGSYQRLAFGYALYKPHLAQEVGWYCWLCDNFCGVIKWDDALIVLALVRWQKFAIQRILLMSRKVDPISWPSY